jgi:hypothetical protein
MGSLIGDTKPRVTGIIRTAWLGLTFAPDLIFERSTSFPWSASLRRNSLCRNESFSDNVLDEFVLTAVLGLLTGGVTTGFFSSFVSAPYFDCKEIKKIFLHLSSACQDKYLRELSSLSCGLLHGS